MWDEKGEYMKRDAIKLALFTLATALTPSAFADQSADKELKLLEELPSEHRVAVHQQVMKFLAQHPEYIESTKFIIAIDREGNVYVLDETKTHAINAGAPSCIGSFRER